RQICADLGSSRILFVNDSLQIKLDDRALFYNRWKDLLAATLHKQNPNKDTDELIQILNEWNGRASVDSAAFPLIETFRTTLSRAIINRYIATATHGESLPLGRLD